MGYQVDFVLTGETPILMHNDDVEAADLLQEWRKDTVNKEMTVRGDDRSPAWTWQTYLYHDGQNVALPSANLGVCLRQAGAQIILKRQKTYKELSQSGMFVTTEFLDFRVDGKQVPITKIVTVREKKFAEQKAMAAGLGFTLDVRRARVGQAKHVRVRPRFNSWTVSGTIKVVAVELGFEVLSQMFGLAGGIGLCDWRPGCKTPGVFGMFRAELKRK